MKRIIAIASGKGGVGKTCVSLNLSLALSELGAKVCLLDADLGLANINILLGFQPQLTFYDMLHNGKSLDEVMFDGPSDVKIIPGGSGIQELTTVDESRYGAVIEHFRKLDERDYLVVDTSAGIAAANIAYAMAAEMVVVIFSPEPTSLTDGFAMIKILANNRYNGKILALPNMFKSQTMAQKSFMKISATARKFLAVDVSQLPPIGYDKVVTDAVINQKPFVKSAPDSAASASVRKVAKKLMSLSDGSQPSDPSDYLRNVVRLANDPALVNIVDKVNTKLAKHSQTSVAGSSAKGAAPPPSTGEGFDNAIMKTILETQRAVLAAFEKNMKMTEIFMEKIQDLSNGKNSSTIETAGDKSSDKKDEPSSRRVETVFLDFEAYLDKNGK